MSYYGNYFGPSYYGNAYWGTGGVAPVIVIDHDGFDGKKHRVKREAKARLHNQLEEAFLDAFGGRPPVLESVIARHDDPLERFIFPPYHEVPLDDEAEEWLLLT